MIGNRDGDGGVDGSKNRLPGPSFKRVFSSRVGGYFPPSRGGPTFKHIPYPMGVFCGRPDSSKSTMFGKSFFPDPPCANHRGRGFFLRGGVRGIPKRFRHPHGEFCAKLWAENNSPEYGVRCSGTGIGGARPTLRTEGTKKDGLRIADCEKMRGLIGFPFLSIR